MTITKEAVANSIVAALRANAAAKSPASDNPLDSQRLLDLIGGVRKGADNVPAKTNLTDIGLSMEAARIAGIKAGSAERKSRRRKAALARRHRHEQIQALVESKTQPDPDRVTAAWRVVLPMHRTIETATRLKQRRVRRHIGDLAQDLSNVVVEKLVLVYARSDWDLDVLATAATYVGLRAPVTPLPLDADDAERKHHKRVRKGCGFVMGVMNNVILQAIDDAYRSDENAKWAPLDILDTVLHNSTSGDDDPYYARFKADRAPSMSGWRWAQPGSIDPALLSTALAAAITDRHLDPLVELFLAEGNTHPNGTFRWEALAEQVFLKSPGPGQWMWDTVAKATQDFKHADKVRARMAREHVTNLFAWVPTFMIDAIQALHDMPFGDGKRYPLVPALSFHSPAEAAAAIAAIIDDLS